MSDERGDLLLRGLLKLVGFLLAVALVAHEGIAIAVNHVQLDGIAGEAASSAAATPRHQRTEPTVERAARAALDGTGASLEQVEMTGDRVAVVVARDARVLVIHRLPPLAGIVEGRVARQAPFR